MIMNKIILRTAAMMAAAVMMCGAAKSALAQQAATVEARSTPGGVAVTWRLTEPTTRVTFLDENIVRTEWTVTTPGLTLAEGAVEGGEPFQVFEIRIAPDATERDRGYLALTRIGAGRILYGPALMLQGMDAELTARAAAGETALPTTQPGKGYVYLGPDSNVEVYPGARVVQGETVSPKLAAIMRDGFAAAQAFYGARLGRDMPYEPTLLVTVDSPGPMAFRGDVTDSGVISARFHGSAWENPPADVAVSLATFVWHETFHLWNGHRLENRDGEAAPWLHEGGAEYGALAAAVSTGMVTEAAARETLSQRLNGCRKALGDRDYDPARLRSGSPVYDCGTVVQWLADLETRQASFGARDIFDLWKDVLDQGMASEGYGVAEFRARPEAERAVALLMDGPGAERWQDVAAGLAALGVVLEEKPSPDEYRLAALFHLNGENCTGGSTGFYRTEQGVRLDTGDKCGVLSGDPLLAAVEGHDPMAEATAMFFAVQARCMAASAVRVITQEGAIIEAKCDRPLIAPRAWSVATAPPLATRTL
ncbi:hypothetical protein D1604_06420 [Brevundimonas sp. LPMIX5]|nr:hypothetical protein D1604_06420 [Brevundimonas sp. LPMIX5]